MSTDNTVSAIIVGAGNRALTYASYALDHPDELEIVGVADPNDTRRRKVAERYDLSSRQCFRTAEEVAEQPKFADAVINGTMDHQHVPTSIPLLEAGYHILLEKPFATSEEEMWELLEAVNRYDQKVLICHVLRYTLFYSAIRQRILAGKIGDVIHIETTEHLSYHHMAAAYIRGKWANRKVVKSSLLMAKCCHDLDIITWMKSGISPSSVASFGSNMQFRPENAPEGAGSRCLVDCEVESTCMYSARKHYIDHPERWGFYVWQSLEDIENPSLERKIEELKREDNPFGRCVWERENDVVDHQVVIIEFEDGSTATHNMIGGTSRPSRSIHITGTEGEIEGTFEDNEFVVRHKDPRPNREYSEEKVLFDIDGDMHGAFGEHGGGDPRLVEDFVRVLRGEDISISTTSIEDSVYGHLIGFRADRSMQEHRVLDVPLKDALLPAGQRHQLTNLDEQDSPPMPPSVSKSIG
jgi:predicted dehydrogenase